MESIKSLVVFTWDGISKPLKYLYFDSLKDFDLLVYDYSGNADIHLLKNIKHEYFISQKSECKGHILEHVSIFLNNNNLNYNFEYIGLFDDDIFVTIKDINKSIFIAKLENLDVFQISLTHDSFFNHRQFVNKKGFNVIKTDWVEIMAPFYKLEIFNKASKYFNQSISGTGIDVYLIPTIQRLLNKKSTGVIHSVQMKHCRPIRTDGRVFSNGMNNLQEIKNIQLLSKQLYQDNINFFDEHYKINILNKKYTYGIPIKYKLQRLPLMFKNLYKFLVDESYR